MADVSVLDVLLYDHPIGTITNVGSDRTIFSFNESYINDPDRKTLSLGFNDEIGMLLTDFKPRQKRVMPFFSNLLPEGDLRKYLADKASVNSEREFYLLWALGHDLPGAVTIITSSGDAWPPSLRNHEHGDGDGDKEILHENALRFSLAGVQLKFSAISNASGGLTIPASGVGGSWIVKLPSREFSGVPENEFSMMTLARMIGMNVPAINLVDVASIKNLPEGIEKIGNLAFAIERFDRLSDKTAVHIEDFAQVFGVYPEDKYKTASLRNIAKVLAAEGSDNDIIEFVRRMTFNVLIGNGDMHLKNWSLIYPDRRQPALAPAYDFVSTIPYIPRDTSALNFSRTKDFNSFTEDELSHLAVKSAIPERLVLETARETIALFHQHWAAEKNNLPMRNDVRGSIEHHIKTLPIA
jgi:serine/threonine-protein kinase HipA